MITDLNPYPAMKDSGVEWFGRVPDHWDVVPLCAIAKTKSIINRQDRELLSVYLNRGVIRFSEVDEKRTNVTSEDLSKYQAVDPGDFVLNNQQAWRGSVGVSKHTGIISPAYLVLSVDPRMNSDFANLLFRDRSMVSQYLVSSKGVGSIQRNLYWPHLKRASTLLPPTHEQVAIMRYLDHADRRVRRYVRAKQKVIGLLEEHKAAIIHRAVTRGLDPNVSLKPSGIDWLGDVPEHWEVTRLKSHLCRNDSGVWGDQFSDEGTVVLRSTEQTVTGGWRITTPAKRELSPTEVHSALLEAGDLVVTKSSGSQAHIGKTSLVDQEIAQLRCCFSNFMQRLRLDKATDPAFIWRNLNSPVGREQLVFQSTTTTGLGNLNGTILGNCRFAFPPLPEQAAIVEYLDQATANLDTAIARARREIDLLREYRTRLIADVVMGKLDVRGVELPALDEAEVLDDRDLDEYAEEEEIDDTGEAADADD